MSKQRAALYVRVSSDEQKLHGLSVDSQILALQEYCKNNNMEVVNIYNDAGFSASKRLHRRGALKMLCDDVKSGLIDIILFTKLDRWFRSVPDYYAIQQILDDNKVPWRAIWEDYETETSAGVFKVNIMLSIAQAEAQRTSERIKAVNEYKRETGKFVGGRAPWGYLNKGSTLVKDETEKAHVEEFFRIYLDTFSIYRAMDYLHSIGMNHNRTQVKRWLKMDYYHGEHGGYTFEPYISKEEHERILKSIENRRTRNCKATGRVYIFGGLIRCPACGAIMGGHTEIKRRKDGSTYERKEYICFHALSKLCPNKAQPTEAQIEAFLLKSIDEDIKKHNELVIETSETADTEKQIKALSQRLKRVGDRYEEGEIDRAQYLAKKEDLQKQIKALEFVKPAIVAPLPSDWQDAYTSLDLQRKKDFWGAFISEIAYTGKHSDPIIHYLE
jgi:DNA invertase Pin-like site-specific DNA recombinase